MANRSEQNCPVCHRPMTRFAGGWKCMNIKAPEHDNTRKHGRKGGAGRPPKKGKT